MVDFVTMVRNLALRHGNALMKRGTLTGISVIFGGSPLSIFGLRVATRQRSLLPASNLIQMLIVLFFVFLMNIYVKNCGLLLASGRLTKKRKRKKKKILA